MTLWVEMCSDCNGWRDENECAHCGNCELCEDCSCASPEELLRSHREAILTGDYSRFDRLNAMLRKRDDEAAKGEVTAV